MPASRTWLKNPLAIFTANGLDARGGLVVQDGLIVEVLAIGQQPSAPCGQVFDAREHVILPGLINTHHHFYQTLTRAWAPVVNQPLFPWLKTLYPVWARLTPEKLALATKVALAELLLSGCTTAADHHYLFPDGLENAIDVQVQSVRELGMSPRGLSPVGKLKLVSALPGTLQPGTDGLFRTANSQPLPADDTLRVAPGALEGSNVSPTSAMVAMIDNSRRYDMQMKAISTADENAKSANSLLSLS